MKNQGPPLSLNSASGKAPQFKLPIPGGKTKAKEESVAAGVPKAKPRRKSA